MATKSIKVPSKPARAKAVAPKGTAAKSATASRVASKASSPKTASPKTASPKTASVKTASPKTASLKTTSPKMTSAKTLPPKTTAKARPAAGARKTAGGARPAGIVVPPGRISLGQLEQMIADPATPPEALRPYLVVDETRSQPFGPVLAPNPATVDMPATAEARARGDIALASLNWVERMKRRMAFERRMAGGYDGPVIVSEGDSWFQYPVLLWDVIDNLAQDYAILSLDAAGDTLQQMVDQGEYLTSLKSTGASIFLFSAGGNDVLGGGNLKAHLLPYDPARSPEQHLLPSFDALLDHAIALYDRILRDVEKLPGGVHTICHGYDRALPNGGRWLGRPMLERGITDPAFQARIVAVMVDRFNARLERLTSHFARVSYLDLRGVVGPKLDRWNDELHPQNPGYADVAARFRREIQRLAPPRARDRAVALPATRKSVAAEAAARAVLEPHVAGDTGRKGLSLHVGLNSIDPAHYQGSSGLLAACEADAEAMRAIAENAGFETRMLLSAQATRGAVIDHIRAAADACAPGDIFLFTYAGHGAQVPDLNGDEPDRMDETFCLFDGMLVDDEVYDLWCAFKPEVRVVVVSDSCHSGSVTRMAPVLAAAAPDAPAQRLLPLPVALKTFEAHRAFYAGISRSVRHADEGRLVRALATPLQCSVLLLSGCQDNQTSADGPFNGRFTEELLKVWHSGSFARGYEAFHRRIVAGMPPAQSPNLWFIGAPNPAFLRQKPFSI
ncbi:caspase family protein [Xanthobacter sp. KR7-65]|uniref:caspase family protein n=1 Tax=Xanthobacter sp. KR7-65 TaxID=3156612 RepID=UPI0032B4621D